MGSMRENKTLSSFVTINGRLPLTKNPSIYRLLSFVLLLVGRYLGLFDRSFISSKPKISLLQILWEEERRMLSP
jgi:hypothetical protein